jgi:hypothetical protein
LQGASRPHSAGEPGHACRHLVAETVAVQVAFEGGPRGDPRLQGLQHGYIKLRAALSTC